LKRCSLDNVDSTYVDRITDSSTGISMDHRSCWKWLFET